MARSKAEKQAAQEHKIQKQIGTMLMLEIKKLTQERHDKVLKYFKDTENVIRIRADDSSFSRDKKKAIETGQSDLKEFENRTENDDCELRMRLLEIPLAYKDDEDFGKLKFLLFYFSVSGAGVFDYKQIPIKEYEKFDKNYLMDNFIKNLYEKYQHNKTNKSVSKFDSRFLNKIIIQQNIFKDIFEREGFNFKYEIFLHGEAIEHQRNAIEILQNKDIDVKPINFAIAKDQKEIFTEVFDIIKTTTRNLSKSCLTEVSADLKQMREASNNIRPWDITVGRVNHIENSQGNLESVLQSWLL